MALATCNSANNHHFLHRESLFHSVRQVCAFSSISSVCYHLSSAGEEDEVGRLGWGEGGCSSEAKRRAKRRQHPYQRPGCWASDKNRNGGRLASISAGVDGPIDSSTAASGCWAIEGIRQTAYDEMRWEDNFWQALHPPPISNHPCLHTHTYTQTCTHTEKK